MARVFSWVLNFVYAMVILLAAPLLVWQAARTGKYRQGFREKFLGVVPRRQRQGPCVWIHAVSVGEVNLIAVVLKAWRVERPTWDFVVSTTSKTGYELAQQKFADLTVFYCPLDFSWAVRGAMRRVRPSHLVLAELELWPNLISAAREHGATVAVINGRLSDRSFPGYKRVRPLVAWMLKKVDLIAAQDQESANRFLALGAPADRVHVTGSLKYDGARTDRNNERTAQLKTLLGICTSDVVFLAGSTQEPEEQIAIETYRQAVSLHPNLRLILVPRHPERFDAVERCLQASGLPWIRRSKIGSARDLKNLRPIILVDSVGELGSLWGAAHIAFVGGSFGPRGGQNMIEPAAFGAAVSFGPNTRNFRDIVCSLLAAEAAVVVGNEQEFGGFVNRCLEEPSYAEALGRRAQMLVKSQLGATQRTLQLLAPLQDESVLAAKTRRSAA